MTYRKSREQSSSTWNGSDTTPALENVDCMVVIPVNYRSPDDTAHNLGENVRGHFAPREVSTEGEGQGHSWIDVAPGDASRYPSTKSNSCISVELLG